MAHPFLVLNIKNIYFSAAFFLHFLGQYRRLTLNNRTLANHCHDNVLINNTL